MIEPKRHFKKPIELSPLIAIDRERCILCYRCVRFSQEVSEDYQLVFLERGDHTFVGTNDGAPYVAPFSGNIVELCPVGALDVDLVPLPRAPVGRRGLGLDLRALPEPVQHRVHRPRRRADRARDVAPQRGRRGRLAVRQGPLRLPGGPLAGADHRSRWSARAARCARRRGSARSTAAAAGLEKAGAATAALAGGETHERGGLPAPAADARRARLAARRLAPERRARPRAGARSSRGPT